MAATPRRGNAVPSTIARKVYSCIGATSCAAEKIMQEQAVREGAGRKIEMLWEHGVDEVLGDDSASTGVRGATSRPPRRATSRCRVLRRDRPHPEHQLFDGQLEMKNGYITIRTGLDGFATATSVTACSLPATSRQVYRQAITSAGFGCMAALDAEKFSTRMPRRWRRFCQSRVPLARVAVSCGTTQARRLAIRHGAGVARAELRILRAARRGARSPSGKAARGSNPFVSHAFSAGLEANGCLRSGWGWTSACRTL